MRRADSSSMDDLDGLDFSINLNASATPNHTDEDKNLNLGGMMPLGSTADEESKRDSK